MIHKLLKFKLDKLKKVISIETSIDYKLSYGDVVLFLINHYEKTKHEESLIEQKLLFSTPLQKKSINIATKLDGKQRVSYSLEN